MKKVLLIIRDGWGDGKDYKGRFVVKVDHALKTIKSAGLKTDLKQELIILPRETILPFFEEKWRMSEIKGLKRVYYRTNPGAKFFIAQLKYKKAINVLDLGCGDGRFTIKYAQQGIKTLGIDFSKYAIKRLLNRAKELKLAHLVKGKVADIIKIDYGIERFDGISCCNTLHYFKGKQLKNIVENIKKATKKRGINYLALETDIDMELPDGRKFLFEGQLYVSSREIEKIIKSLYSGWKIVKVFKTHNSIKATLPENIQKLLGTSSQFYKRSFSVVDIIAKRQ